MSESRSATPTPNTFVTNNTPSLLPTTSRPPSHEHSHSVPVSVGREQPFTSRPHPSPSTPLHPGTSHPTTRLLTRPAESPIDEPMAKRFRRESPQTRVRSETKSSPSSDSQDDMADTEMDDRHNQPSETPAPIVAPKKKRTRTLTTPHQSAVLHALLAQSRFPTTAMREEVGRSIGLSARKVQIWFQNQRQKARRPRSPTDASRRRLPQYGPFPSGPDASAVGSFSLADPGTNSRMTQPQYPSSMGFTPPDQSGYSGYHSSESFPGSLDSPTQLLGPGMPGIDAQPDPPYRERSINAPMTISAPNPRSLTSVPYAGPAQRFLRSPSPPYLYPAPSSRPTTTSRLHERKFSRTLPPLIFSPPQGRSSYSAPSLHGIYTSTPLPGITPPLHKRSMSPEATFAHHPPELPSRPPTTLPHPYTLQPALQWDSSTMPLNLRSSEPLPRSRPGSHSASRSATPIFPKDPSTTIPDSGPDEKDASEAALPRRSRRYDPVRATFIYTTISEPPQDSTQDSHGRSPREDDRKDTEVVQSPPNP